MARQSTSKLSDARYRLSKSKYCTGLQCHRLLWWHVHEPNAPELVPGPALQLVFDHGSQVGAVARRYFPGGVLVDAPHTRPSQRIAQTERALADGASVIYEASFFADGIFVAADILERLPGGSFALTEVKSTTRVKEEHLPDVAVQVHVLRASGLQVVTAHLMHLNRACAHPDLSNLFASEDVTNQLGVHLAQVPAEARRQLDMLAGPLPEIATRDRCQSPYACPFVARCTQPAHEHHISTLYRLQAQRAAALESDGIETILDLQDAGGLSAVQQRQHEAVTCGALVVAPGLGQAMAQLVPTIAYLDFETVSLPIPAWNGCHPYDAVPAQVSVHLERATGAVESFSWIADGPGDPRPACARALAPVLSQANVVVAYNASFERRCLQQLADAATGNDAAVLHRAAAGILDLLPIVRNHVCHPAFHGSFSLKSVLPALVPGAGYEGLEVAEGNTAAAELERLMFAGASEKRRADLIAYCGRDTEGLVQLARVLRGLVTSTEPRTTEP